VEEEDEEDETDCCVARGLKGVFCSSSFLSLISNSCSFLLDLPRDIPFAGLKRRGRRGRKEKVEREKEKTVREKEKSHTACCSSFLP
jgi:hypothetical protein